MKGKQQPRSPGSSKHVVIIVVLLSIFIFSADGSALPPPGAALPDIPVVCMRSDRPVKLSALSISHMTVLVFSGGESAAGPGELPLRTIAALVARYGDTIPWYRVVVREKTGDGAPRQGSSCTVLFHRTFHDMHGKLAEAIGIQRFPALLVLRRGGEIETFVEGLGPEDLRSTESILSSVHRSSELRGTKARDFRLPEAGTGWPLSLLDASQRNYTMILVLEKGSGEAVREFRLLEGVRSRHRNEVGLVAVFEGGGDEGVIDYLGQFDLTPDFALDDGKASMAKSYRFGRLPALLLVGPEGKILFAKIGFDGEDAAPLALRLEQYLSRGSGPSTPFLEARRIRSDALSWLREGNDAMALIYLERVLEIVPEMESVHRRMAEIHGRLGNRREAARCYSRAISSGMCDAGEAITGLSEVIGAGR